ncbi:hypothetical protein EOA19_27465 [Mesorhizobium sp. M7A.F.Ca.US.010.02.1.1]|nr:hypothetical protein EOA19_27465 [Mesorhizobium sp. M7A.F.Ca.US.010.02.1.1]
MSSDDLLTAHRPPTKTALKRLERRSRSRRRPSTRLKRAESAARSAPSSPAEQGWRCRRSTARS